MSTLYVPLSFNLRRILKVHMGKHRYYGMRKCKCTQ